MGDMLARLEAEQAADAAKKAWCDRNLADSRQKKSEKIAEIAKQTSRIDLMQATSAQLKEEIAALQGQLAKLAQSQAKMDGLRKEQNTAYLQTRADQEKGLEGLKLALKVLSEYYAGDHDHEQMTDDNEIEKTTKTQDVRYKVKESKRLDEDSAELISDRTTVQTELDATTEALGKMETQCVGFDSGKEVAETHASRKARHAAEIEGLKQALNILDTEGVSFALMQQRESHKLLRGVSRHA